MADKRVTDALKVVKDSVAKLEAAIAVSYPPAPPPPAPPPVPVKQPPKLVKPPMLLLGAGNPTPNTDPVPTRISYIPWDLYEGGDCPVVASQTATRYVDITNGNNSNAGTSWATAWKTLNGKTVSNAVVYVRNPSEARINGGSFLATGTLSNVTIRPETKHAVRIVGDASREYCAMFIGLYVAGAGAHCENLTIWGLEWQDWCYNHVLAGSADSIRILNNRYFEWGRVAGNTQDHCFYLAGSGDQAADVYARRIEIAHNYFEGKRDSGWIFHNYAHPPQHGPVDVVVHHNYSSPLSTGRGAIVQDKCSPTNHDYFCNTFDGNWGSMGTIYFYLENSGAAPDSTWRLRSNILINRGSGPIIAREHGSPNYGATNTAYKPLGGTYYSGTGVSEAVVGVNRNPVLDSAGRATDTDEHGSGDPKADLPAWSGYSDQKQPSSATNVDRGAFQYGS